MRGFNLDLLTAKNIKYFLKLFIRHLSFFFGEVSTSFTNLLTGSSVMLMFNFCSSLYILDINTLSGKDLLPFCTLSTEQTAYIYF